MQSARNSNTLRGVKNILRYSLNPYSLLKGYYLSFTNKLPKAKYCDKQYFISKLETTKSKTNITWTSLDVKTKNFSDVRIPTSEVSNYTWTVAGKKRKATWLLVVFD